MKSKFLCKVRSQRHLEFVCELSAGLLKVSLRTLKWSKECHFLSSSLLKSQNLWGYIRGIFAAVACWFVFYSSFLKAGHTALSKDRFETNVPFWMAQAIKKGTFVSNQSLPMWAWHGAYFKYMPYNLKYRDAIFFLSQHLCTSVSVNLQYVCILGVSPSLVSRLGLAISEDAK